jgi:hypothetical protein
MVCVVAADGVVVAVTVNAAAAYGGPTDRELGVTLSPSGTLGVTTTVPANVSCGVIPILKVPLPPTAAKLRLLGVAATLKSGMTTVMGTVVSLVREPLVPITLTLYVPGVFDIAVNVADG